MSCAYTPDNWLIVKITAPTIEAPIYKVLAGWHGGYAHGDSWRMNSGITKIIEFEDHYEVSGSSGSVYVCYKEGERMMLIIESVYRDTKSRIEKAKGAIEIVEISTILEMFKKEK